MALGQSSFSLFVLFLLLSLSQILDAANLNTKKDPQGQLAVRLDYELATRRSSSKGRAPSEKGHSWIWSSHLKFQDSVTSITPGQLKKMAIDAHAEMQADMAQYNVDEPADVLPGVMTIMAYDNEIILASSQKGSSVFVDGLKNSPVKYQLQECRAAFSIKNPTASNEAKEHKNSRKCGELQALHHYFSLDEHALEDADNTNARDPHIRITSVFARHGETANIIPACGTGDEVSYNSDFILCLGNELICL